MIIISNSNVFFHTGMTGGSTGGWSAWESVVIIIRFNSKQFSCREVRDLRCYQ